MLGIDLQKPAQIRAVRTRTQQTDASNVVPEQASEAGCQFSTSYFLSGDAGGRVVLSFDNCSSRIHHTANRTQVIGQKELYPSVLHYG
jgi:hypothetical protein